MFYLIRRNDGHLFIQRYIPRNYGDTTFEVLASGSAAEVFKAWRAAV